MAISISINTASAANEMELIRAFTTHHGYTDTIADGNGGTVPNPQTRLAFLRQPFRRQIREAAQSQRRAEAAATASAAVTEIDVT